MLLHLLFSELQSNHYSLSDFEKRLIWGVITQQLNESWSDCYLLNGRWKSIWNCIFYIYIILWYDHSSNIHLEPKLWVRENETLLHEGYVQKPRVHVRCGWQPRQGKEGRLFARVSNKTEPNRRSKHGRLARHPDLLLTLLPGLGCTHSLSFSRSPQCQLRLPVHRHIWDMDSPSEPSTWSLIPG